MPVFTILCPDCGQESKTLVLKGLRMPTEWVCSRCGSRRAQPDPDKAPEPHPWETGHGAGCPCCGG
jgi:hypothetical protein